MLNFLPAIDRYIARLVIVPMVGAFFIDIVNAAMIQVFIKLLH